MSPSGGSSRKTTLALGLDNDSLIVVLLSAKTLAFLSFMSCSKIGLQLTIILDQLVGKHMLLFLKYFHHIKVKEGPVEVSLK